MARTEFRVRYQVVDVDREPLGRVWCHIAHTRKQTLAFVAWLGKEAQRRAGKRGYRVIGIDTRPVGRWTPMEGTVPEMMQVLKNNPSLEGRIKK